MEVAVNVFADDFVLAFFDLNFFFFNSPSGKKQMIYIH